MKKETTLVLVAASLIFIASSLPALAENANAKGGFFIDYKPGTLQKPKQSHYKGEIQIVDETPDVKVFTKPAPGPSYQIKIDPAQAAPGGGLSIQSGGMSTGNSPRIIQLTPSQDGRLLGGPGFESNMNSLQAPKQNLAPGVTTGVHAQMNPPASSKPASFTSQSAKRQLLNQTRNSNPRIQIQPASYQPYAQNSTQGSTGNSTSVRVTGELKEKKRGLLLKQAK